MSYNICDKRTRSLESRLEEILSEEDFSDFSENQRHMLLDALSIHGSGKVREIVGELRSGA